jgi:hypothetical protein
MLGADDKKELKEYILKIKSELAQVSFFSSEKIKHKYQRLPKLNLSWLGFLFFSFWFWNALIPEPKPKTPRPEPLHKNKADSVLIQKKKTGGVSADKNRGAGGAHSQRCFWQW